MTVILLSVIFAVSTGRPWLGCALVLRNPGQDSFLWVAEVPEGTPARRAGLRAGDVINVIDGKRLHLRDNASLVEWVRRLRPGQVVSMNVVRGGKTSIVHVTVGTLPPEFEQRTNATQDRALRDRHESPPNGN